MFTSLASIASVNLGYKSLQNSFYYVNEATISSFGIEKRFLTPIVMMRDFEATAYIQEPDTSVWLFNCKEDKSDLRGTGAYRYIEAMGDRAAAEKKQSGGSKSIRQVLEAQGGRTWYAPKASPNKKHIWLRKAFNSIYAPFIFDKPALVDQRCNSISPIPEISWQELAAVLTSTIFAYSLEINGAASMGAGALEAPTTKLRDYPVIDIRLLKSGEREKIVALAEKVWSAECPLDWGKADTKAGKHLRALDALLIKATGSNVSIDRVYTDLHSVCRSRLNVGSDKEKKTKKRTTESIGGVAESIAMAIGPKIQIKNFPDSFLSSNQLDINMSIDRNSLRQIQSAKFLGDVEIKLISKAGKAIYHASHPSAVAEAIVRSILWGRTTFSVSSNHKIMDKALDKFLVWADEIASDIEKSIAESALGTGYEETLKKEIYARLGINPLAVSRILPDSILLG